MVVNFSSETRKRNFMIIPEIFNWSFQNRIGAPSKVNGAE
jgi:hypothetical protein